MKQYWYALLTGTLLFSCAPVETSNKIIYVRDSNKDSIIDEYRYYIGSGVYVFVVDSNYDGFFDKEFSVNRSGIKYDNGTMTKENIKNVHEIQGLNYTLIYY